MASPEENKKKIRELFAAIDGAQGMGPLEQHADAAYKGHFPGMDVMDRAGVQAFGDSFFGACPGLRHTIHEVLAEGDMVSLRMVVSGADTKPFVMPAGTVPPTGKELTLEVQNMFRMSPEGKALEQWSAFDMLGLMQTLGVIPEA
jgi:predicted ester cyclase